MKATIDNRRDLKPRMRCADDFVPIWRGCQFGWKSWNTDRNFNKKNSCARQKNTNKFYLAKILDLLGVFTLN